MTSLIAVVALAAAHGGPSFGSDIYTMRIGDREVRFDLKPRDSVYPKDVLAWDGWGLSGRGVPRTPFKTASIPPDYDALYRESLRRLKPGAPEFKAKFIIATNVEHIDPETGYVPTAVRWTLSESDVDRLHEQVARAAAMLQARSMGAFRVRALVELDPEPIFGFGAIQADASRGDGDPADVFPRFWGHEYMELGSNFGSEGPADAVAVIHPAPTAGDRQTASSLGIYTFQPSIANGDRRAFVPDSPALGPLLYTHLRSALLGKRARYHLDMEAPPDLARFWPSGVAPAEVLRLVVGVDEPSAEQVRLVARTPIRIVPNDREAMFTTTHRVGDCEVRLVEDPERGKVISYREEGVERRSGFAAPNPGGIPKGDFRGWSEADRYLTFHVKSSTQRPVAILIQDEEGTPLIEYVLGLARSRFTSAMAMDDDLRWSWPSRNIEFKADGTWQRITLDLRQSPARRPASFSIATPQVFAYHDRPAGATEVLFDDFRVHTEATQGVTRQFNLRTVAMPSAEDPYLRALWLTGAARTETEREQGLADPSEIVRAAAMYALSGGGPRFEAIVARMLDDASPFVAELTLDAHCATGANPELLRRAITSPHDRVRTYAISRLEYQYPSDVPLLQKAVLLGGRNTKVAVAGALVKAGPEAASLMSELIGDRDPHVRLAALRSCPYWTAGTEHMMRDQLRRERVPSLRARLLARLITSPMADATAVAKQAFRENAPEVRGGFLGALHRNMGGDRKGAETRADRALIAARLGLRDKAPSVRLAALNLLSVEDLRFDASELEPVLSDRHPWVQGGLLGLALAKQIPLPAATVRSLRESSISNISRMAQKLPD